MNHLAWPLIRSDGDHTEDLCERLYQRMFIGALEHQESDGTIERSDKQHGVGHGDVVWSQKRATTRGYVLASLDVQAIQRVCGDPKQQTQQGIRKQVQDVPGGYQRSNRSP